MAHGFSYRVVALAVMLGGFLATASVPQQSCKAEDGHCPAAADDTDEGDHASLLVRMAATKAHNHAAAVEAAAAAVNGTATCNEVKFQGLCYRTCTDMGEMEPRQSPSKCGGVNSYSFIQSCKEDGTSSVGAGSAPGIAGRPMGGCFGDDSASQPSSTAPNMCTMDCARRTPTSHAEGSNKKFCCTDKESTPQVYLTNGELMCACPIGPEPPASWMPQPMGVLKSPPSKPCNTGCTSAEAWLMVDHIAYCCPNNDKPTVTKAPGMGDYTVTCSCP